MKIATTLLLSSLLTSHLVPMDDLSSQTFTYAELGGSAKKECRYSVNRLGKIYSGDNSVSLDPLDHTKVCKKPATGLVYMITTPRVEIDNTKENNNQTVLYSVGSSPSDCRSNMRLGRYLSELLTLQKIKRKVRSVSASQGSIEGQKRDYDFVCMTLR